MEGKQDTQLYTKGTQNKVKLKRELEKFSLDDFLSKINFRLNREGYFIFDTGLYLSSGAIEIMTRLDSRGNHNLKEFVETEIERNIDYSNGLLKLLESKKDSIIFLNTNLREINNNISKFREFICHYSTLNQAKAKLLELFYETYSQTGRNIIKRLIQSDIMNEIYRVNGKYTKFLKTLEAFTQAELLGINPSYEDRSILFSSIRASLKRPVTLFSNDRDLSELAFEIKKNSHELNGTLKKENLFIRVSNFYIAEDEFRKSVIRTYDIQFQIIPSPSHIQQSRHEIPYTNQHL